MLNDILSFGIPTYNGAEMLDEILRHFYNELKLNNFMLNISENCSEIVLSLSISFKLESKLHCLKLFGNHPLFHLRSIINYKRTLIL
jgi:hypothetical protein